jgi:hypothetical protein
VHRDPSAGCVPEDVPDAGPTGDDEQLTDEVRGTAVWRAVLATTGEPGLDEDLVGITVLDVSDPVSLATALDDDDEPVLVLSHERDALAAAVACAVLCGHQPGRVVGHVSASHGPLALAVCLSTARELAEDAGHGAAAVADLLAASWSGAVLTSVTRLSSPNPTVLQHLRSWWPGSRFLVRLQPDPLAVPADRAATAVDDLDRGTTSAFVTSDAGDDPVVRAVLDHVAPAGIRPLDLPGTWTGVLSRPARAQLALIPADVRRVVRPAGPACPGCGQSAADDVCLFCRVHLDRRETVGADFHELLVGPADDRTVRAAR